MQKALRPRLSVISLLGITLIFGAITTAKAQNCENVTDAQLIRTIYSKIKADKALSSQISHINVVVVNAAVKLQGWTNTKSDYDRLRELVASTSCVRVVNVNLLDETPPDANSPHRSSKGCPSGTKSCGDICIPEGDDCSSTAESGP